MATWQPMSVNWASTNTTTTNAYIQLSTTPTTGIYQINTGYSVATPWASPLSEKHHGKIIAGPTVNHTVDKEAGWGGEWLYTRCGYAFAEDELLESQPADSKKHGQRMCRRCVPQYIIDEVPA